MTTDEKLVQAAIALKPIADAADQHDRDNSFTESTDQITISFKDAKYARAILERLKGI